MRFWMTLWTLAALASVGAQPLPFPLSVPPGYQVDLVSNQVRGARFIAVAPNGDIVVALLSRGQVVAVTPGARADALPRVVLDGLQGPNGVAFRGNDLYVATIDAVVRLKNYPQGPVETLVNDLPTGRGHLNRALAIDAQGRIFVSSGSSCNVCQESDRRKATILRYDANGRNGTIYASGLRNASGLTFDDRGQLWAVVNQRDNLVPDHTDLPPDEFNRIAEGGNYGWPWAYPVGNRRVPNPEYPNADVTGFLPTTVNLQAHSAPLQVVFDPARQTFFIAYHGSWNRTPATGYKLVSVKVVGGEAQAPQDFVTGWLTPSDVKGRPVGVALDDSGNLIISDDRGYLFRVSRTGS